jgi:ABC-2 type transport system permease protein
MIILNEIRGFLRDKTSLAFMVAFPIILIYLLGTLLSGQDVSDATIGEIRVSYQIETTDPMEQSIIQDFIKETSNNTDISFKKVTEPETSKQQIAKEELEGLIVFGQDKISLYEGKNQIKNKTIKAMVMGYGNLVKAVTAIADTEPEKLANLKVEDSSYVKEKDFNANRTMLDYYGVTMVVMMIFIGSIGGASSFSDEIRLKTINRLIASPVSRTKIFFQKVIGEIPSAVLELVVVMIVSVLFFDVHYASTVGNNLFLIGLFSLSCFTMLMVGVVVGLFIKANPVLVLMPVLWIMMFLGGTYSKEVNIKGVTEHMPVYVLQQAAFDITVFGRVDKAIPIMVVEVGLIIILSFIGVLKFNSLRGTK